MVADTKKQLKAVLVKSLKIKSRRKVQIGFDYIFPIMVAGLVALYATQAPPAKRTYIEERPTFAPLVEYYSLEFSMIICFRNAPPPS